MYVVEEYLAAIIMAVVVSFAGSMSLLLVLTLQEEKQFLDRGLFTGRFVMPPSWPRL